MPSHYQISPQGVCRHAWINKPDTKFQADGLYHVDLGLDGAIGADFMESIRKHSDEMFLEEIVKKEIKGGELKKWSTYYPFEEEMEEDGTTPTGRVWFKFKQNAKIRQPDGAMKPFVLGIRDSKDKATKANVFGGSIIRVKWKPRAVLMSSAKQAGARLDFSMVQLIVMAEQRGGFGEVEGGYTDDAADQHKPDAEATEADY